MIRSVFISKQESEIVGLIDKLPENTSLLAHSFLSFSALPFNIEAPYDIIFFGSPRAVIYFKNQRDIPKHAKTACIGRKTAELLTQLNHPPAFIGDNSGNPSEVAFKFKNWAGDNHILFPVSNLSLQTISGQFREQQKQVIEVYETLIKGHKIPHCDVYVFTSPSNVRGFLLKNEIKPNATVISWGKSTSKELIKSNVTVTAEMTQSSFEELCKLIPNN